MTGVHWAILAAAAVAAVGWLWWSRRRPRVWASQTWTDEPGDPTREQIDEALDIATEVDRAKADHLNAAMRLAEHPWTHLTDEEAADCVLCSPSSLPRRSAEGGDET